MSYSYSTDEEYYYGDFETPEAAALEVFYDDPEADVVWVGEAQRHTAHSFVCGDWILQDVTERAGDECGETSEDWLYSVMMDKAKVQELTKLVGDWLQEQDPPNFFSVGKVREITRESMVKAGLLKDATETKE